MGALPHQHHHSQEGDREYEDLVTRVREAVRTVVPGAAPVRKDLTREVVAVQGGLGELSLTHDGHTHAVIQSLSELTSAIASRDESPG